MMFNKLLFWGGYISFFIVLDFIDKNLISSHSEKKFLLLFLGNEMYTRTGEDSSLCKWREKKKK